VRDDPKVRANGGGKARTLSRRDGDGVEGGGVWKDLMLRMVGKKRDLRRSSEVGKSSQATKAKISRMLLV